MVAHFTELANIVSLVLCQPTVWWKGRLLTMRHGDMDSLCLDAAKQSGQQGEIHYKSIEMNGLYGDCVEMPDDWEAYEAYEAYVVHRGGIFTSHVARRPRGF